MPVRGSFPAVGDGGVAGAAEWGGGNGITDLLQ